jgi:predicted transcriptional regulator
MALDKRVEVLFDEGEYKRLEEAARARGRSVGSVVREAVAEYVAAPSEEEKRRAIEWFLTHSEGPVGSPEEIKKEIEDGRYEDILKSLETD